MKKIILILFLVFFSFSGEVLASPDLIGASSAKSVVETQVEGDKVEVYQSVETTVNGETVKKESTQPGKLELEMKKNDGESKITSALVTPIPTVKKPSVSPFVVQISEFFRNLFSQCFALVRGLTK